MGHDLQLKSLQCGHFSWSSHCLTAEENILACRVYAINWYCTNFYAANTLLHIGYAQMYIHFQCQWVSIDSILSFNQCTHRITLHLILDFCNSWDAITRIKERILSLAHSCWVSQKLCAFCWISCQMFICKKNQCKHFSNLDQATWLVEVRPIQWIPF